MTRPSEAITGIVGSIVGAFLILAEPLFSLEVTTEVAGALTLLISWVAYAVTLYVAGKQRKGELASGNAGEVVHHDT